MYFICTLMWIKFYSCKKWVLQLVSQRWLGCAVCLYYMRVSSSASAMAVYRERGGEKEREHEERLGCHMVASLDEYALKLWKISCNCVMQLCMRIIGRIYRRSGIGAGSLPIDRWMESKYRGPA
jgi:hypothetical protein